MDQLIKILNIQIVDKELLKDSVEELQYISSLDKLEQTQRLHNLKKDIIGLIDSDNTKKIIISAFNQIN